MAKKIGLKDLKSPSELLEYAKSIVAERNDLDERLKIAMIRSPNQQHSSNRNSNGINDLKRLIQTIDQSPVNGHHKRIKLEADESIDTSM